MPNLVRKSCQFISWYMWTKVPTRIARSRTHTQYIYTYTYRVSQEECARLRENVPYVKVYRYNQKHLYPKLNGYWDNGQRQAGAACGSKYCNLHSWYVTWQCERPWQWNAVFTVPAWRFAQSARLRHRWAFWCIVLVTLKDNYDTNASVFVVQFNGFMSLRS